MIYVMSDLHGRMDDYLALLDKIGFAEDDVLYVLGDTVDMGERAMELLVDMSMRANVYPVAGEHDLLALRMLTGFSEMLKKGGTPDPAFAAEMTEWVKNGGAPTLEGFRALDTDMREGVLDYLSEFALYEEVEAGGRSFVLAHGGIADFDPQTPLGEYEPAQFFAPTPVGARLFPDRTLVVGHEPTKSGRIEREDGVIRVHCGCEAGDVCCLCLDNGEEFYV